MQTATPWLTERHGYDPTLGVEAYVLPVVGRMYLDGKTELALFLGSIYSGPDTVVMLLGLVSLALGAIFLALAIWSSQTLPRWAGVVLAAGLTLWFPLFPQLLRVIDGLLIGMGGVWLSWNLWKNTGSASLNTVRTGNESPAIRQ